MAVRAPEIDQPGIAWLNTPEPLSLAALKGRIVILDFWTFCCINCIHVLPTLRQVEEAFPTEVAVIGVHSPKFAAERDLENVAQAIRRYDIRHPVAHDPEMRLWRQYAVRAWPTLVFVSANGYVIGASSGEPQPEKLLAAVGKLVEQARQENWLAPAELPALAPEESPGRLRFPGKVKPFRRETGEEAIAVADSGHHQILLLDGEGSEQARFGSGRPGFADGAASEASFRDPQGLIGHGGDLFVADTGNHAIRRIHLASGRVETLAGTGRRGRILSGPMAASAAALASPWDLELLDGSLLFANAGTHQLGRLDLAAGIVERLAGSGAEAIQDGPAAEAALAQPSGLALDSATGRLYFADSETSSIRCLEPGPGPAVKTLLGAGLFEFGRVNGPLARARLQHALGLALGAGEILVADSYNQAVRRIDLAAGSIEEFDEGFLCEDPVCLPLGEPAGIALWRDAALLSDTNNHRILLFDRAAGRYRTWFA